MGDDNPGNKEDADKKIVTCLRNGFAHIHIYPSYSDGKISGVEIRSQNKVPYFAYVFDADAFCAFVDKSIDFMRCFEAKTGKTPDEGPEVLDGNVDFR